MKILVTGGNGFIGKAVVRALSKLNFNVRAAVRKLPAVSELLLDASCYHAVGDLNNLTEWGTVLDGVDSVVHCAARAHVMREVASDALPLYRQVNVDGTLQLARQASLAGVKRFVYISSVKVNGESTVNGQRFREDDLPNPQDPYGQSKAEAEKSLQVLASQSQMEVVIIRPPLVYGPGVKGNFASIVKWAKNPLPLPLGAVDNHRSLVALENLVSLIVLCSNRDLSPNAVNQVFLVADIEDVSTTELLQKVARAANRSPLLVPIPMRWLNGVARLLGKRDLADRLFGNLQVDTTKARSLLDWHPVVTMDEQLRQIFSPQK